MNRDARVGLVVEGSKSFIGPLEAEMRRRYRVTHFVPPAVNLSVGGARLNHALLKLQLSQFMREHDVVLFEWATRLLAEATQLRKRCPIITRLLGYELYTWAPNINWDRVDVIVVLLEEVKRQFSARFPQQGHKCVVIPTGIDLLAYDPVPQPYRGNVGTLGYITPRKRVYELILAFVEMLAAGLDLHLHVAGMPGSDLFARDYVPIPRLADKLGISDRVHLEGYVNDAPRWFKKIDIFVSNSYTETQHVALQEAMASSCYCLAHFWDGVEEFMPKEYLFGTNRQLVDKVVAFHHMPSDVKLAKQREMRQLVEGFCDSRKVVPALLELIDGLAR